MRVLKRTRGLSLVLVMCMLGACAETQLVSHAVKEIQVEPSPTPQGVYKVGDPYQIDGVWYYPAVDYDYAETGIASWYGREFHGKATANGEIYDMNDLTAAHRTLPMPSIVRVTNLENGRALILRINDRGPFARGRIIDLSRRSAQLLGFARKGTAKVQVKVLAPESRQVAMLAQRTQIPEEARAVAAAPRIPVSSETLPPPPGTTAVVQQDGSAANSTPTSTSEEDVAPGDLRLPTDSVTQEAVQPTNIFIQVGAFSEYGNAIRLSAALSGLGPTRITQIQLGDRGMFRVRIGPIASIEAADRLLSAVVTAGYPEANIIVD